MESNGLWPRVFVGLLIAVLPPILAVVAADNLAPLLADADPRLIAISIVGIAIGWAAILGVVFARVLADDVRSFRALAQRGEHRDAAELGSDYRQIAGALDERNRQVATLARGTGSVPIDDEPRTVVGALVALARSVMGDPTWTCAVLASEDPELLPPGVYGAPGDEPPVRPIGDLERWASVTRGEAEMPVVHLEGPWGAFVAVDVRVSERLGGILLAPWEGRARPTAAEIGVLSLVGQHAGTAIEHSILYARVHRQADELNRLAAVQADFLRGVTHDLQTPLTSIGAIATELRASGLVPIDGQADLDTIAHQAERLRRMVSQLLVASRLEAGVLTPQAEVFSVRPLVERTWAALLSDRPFEVVVEGAPYLAFADPDRVEQVLWALLDNAVKYSPASSPISVRIVPRGGMLAVTVRDEGVGMDEETRARAFDQFYRSDRARRMAPDGSGVGLYAARGLVEAMGGRVSIKSELGRGTALTIELPAEQADADVEESTPAS